MKEGENRNKKIALSEVRFRKYTPYHKKAVMKFLDSLSLHTRELLSVSGIDSQTIYNCFKEDWKDTGPIILYQGQEAIAIGKVSPRKDGFYLSCLVVRDDMQRKGFGTELVKYMFALAILNGTPKMYLEVKTDNLIGISFFKKLGFQMIKEQGTICLMEKRLI